MLYKTSRNNAVFYQLLFFTTFLGIITYGFALTNYTLSIDNEIPIFPDFALNMGRWGQNLIRYHVFGGHLQYFTQFLGILFFSLAAVFITNLFKFKKSTAFIFCSLFITFPQVSYQLIFNMMADVAGFGFLLSVLSVVLFVKKTHGVFRKKDILYLFLIALIIAFVLSIYQALIFVPFTIYILYFFQQTFENNFEIKRGLQRLTLFSVFLVFGIILYYLSVKILCPPVEKDQYLSSFWSGNHSNIFINFYIVLKDNLLGKAYYGEALFIIVPILVFLLTIKFFFAKKLFICRFLILIYLLISPFLISFLITNGYHPPRLYVSSNLIFSYLIVFSLNYFKIKWNVFNNGLALGLVLTNIFLVTNLFQSNNKIFKHDKRIAEKIDNLIQCKYPTFCLSEKNIYFYGYFPYEYHQKFRLQNSEIFGGSIFNWDNGNNYRIINFFREADIAEYKLLDNKEKYYSIKDSIEKMPVWPNQESIKMINDVVVVKLGQNKGQPLPCE